MMTLHFLLPISLTLNLSYCYALLSPHNTRYLYTVRPAPTILFDALQPLKRAKLKRRKRKRPKN